MSVSGTQNLESVEIEFDEREKLIEHIESVIDESLYKSVGDGRIRNPDNERIRAQYLRIAISAVGEYRQLLNDRDMAELDARLERIEQLEL